MPRRRSPDVLTTASLFLLVLAGPAWGQKQGGTLVIEKQNQGKAELWRVIQRMVDNREGVEILRKTPSLVMYRFHPQ